VADTHRSTGDQPVILIVDDDEIIRKMLSVLLTSWGYSILEAGDGVEALAVVEQKNVIAILLDVMMPRMDGFEVCRRLKRDSITAHIPVILVTALIDQGHRRQGLEAGADDFVNKPVVVADLQAVLRRTLPDGRHGLVPGAGNPA